MKIDRILFLLSFLLLSFISCQAQKVNSDDIFGYYSIQKPGKAFSDISEIHLSGEYGAREKPPFYGLIRLKNKSTKDFRLNKPVLKGKNISFVSKAVGGVYYRFNGAFTKNFNKVLETGPPSSVPDVLRGALVKYKGKNKIAEANVRLNYFSGD